MRGASVLILLLTSYQCAHAMSLDEYLKIVSQKNKSIQSLDVSKELAEDQREAGDIELTPVFSLGAEYVNDKNPASQLAFLGATESKITTYKAGINKKFSSGTLLGLNATASEFEYVGLSGQIPSEYSTGSLGVSLSQSLWKDFFGRATRLRWDREVAVAEATKGKFDLQQRGLLIQAESSFWSYMYAVENLRISRDSLERAKRIENWTRRRVNDGIGDRADLLEAQALVQGRQLMLVGVEDEYQAAIRQIRDFMELSDSEPMPALSGDFEKSRSIAAMVQGDKGKKIVQLDAYLAALEAKAAATQAREVDDSFKPDLNLYAQYNTNAQESSLSKATTQWTDTATPTSVVGVRFSYLFGTDAKNSAQAAAKKAALAAKLQSERKMLESESAWIELNRRYSELSKRVQTAEVLAKLQSDRAKAQADLFNKGRSITANVISAEEDAAEAALNLTKLKSEQRKMEAQGRLFIAVEE